MEKFSVQVVSVMFGLLAVENFLTRLLYFERLTEKIDNIRPQTAEFVELKLRRDCKDFIETIETAKHELFISGINLHSLSGYGNLLLKCTEKGIKVKFLVMNDFETFYLR
ncbi:hypothetical protein FACS1894120_5930 [Clostridia bacterium]|nr:hypothetical protein FACS1894120_5930 [Clostridia bacterium]